MDNPQNVLAAVLGLGFLLTWSGLGIVWWLSRAQNMGSIETRVYGQMQLAASRLEHLEGAFSTLKLHVAEQLEAVEGLLAQIEKNRRRISAQNKRAEQMQEGAPNGPEPIVDPNDRGAVIRAVRERMRG